MNYKFNSIKELLFKVNLFSVLILLFLVSCQQEKELPKPNILWVTF